MNTKIATGSDDRPERENIDKLYPQSAQDTINSLMQVKKIKSTIRGGMGSGRGDNPHDMQGY